MKDDFTYQFSQPNLYISLQEGWGNVRFELGNERVKKHELL